MNFIARFYLALCYLKICSNITLYDWTLNKYPEYQGGSAHECYRKCDGKHKICHYNFTILQYSTMGYLCKNCPFELDDCYNDGCVTGDGWTRMISSINMQLPGPSIQVCEGDTVVVHVTNTLPYTSTTIHWHGILQRETPWMDGVPMVTQCPISSGETLKYEFKAEPAGTHLYHGHVEFQQHDGLFGNLIVRRPNDSQSSLYDYDLAEHVMVLWHWYPAMNDEVLKITLFDYSNNYGRDLIINGRGSDFEFKSNGHTYVTPLAKFNVAPGKRYRFRLIYNSAPYCPVQVSIDDHKLLAISTGTGQFEPVEVDSIMIDAGERYDFVLNANQPVKNYLMRLRGLGDCLGDDKSASVKVSQLAILHYIGAKDIELNCPIKKDYDKNNRDGVLLNPVDELNVDYSNNAVVRLTDLVGTSEETGTIAGPPNSTFYFTLYKNTYDKLYTPGAFGQVDNISFVFPTFPLLTQSWMITETTYCTPENKSAAKCLKGYCQCPYVVHVEEGSLVEIVLINQGQEDHPMHFHGYDFFVVAMDIVANNDTLLNLKSMNEQGLIRKNLKNPIRKDTVRVPTAGYTIIRFVANNPGYWLVHCHVSFHLYLGMGFILKVGEDENMKSPPAYLKKCWPQRQLFM